MSIFDIFRRSAPKVETRAAGSGFTAELMAARASYISGRSGLGELTAAVQGCVTLWEGAFAAADVSGPELLTRHALALAARGLALRGEAVFLVDGDRLRPAHDWEVSTRGGEPRAYRLSIADTGGAVSRTALAPEVLHFRTGSDPVAPWAGAAPLRRAALSAELLHALEDALREVFADTPLGSMVVPIHEMAAAEREALARDFRGRRGSVVLRESVQVGAAGGPAPAQDWRPSPLSPDLKSAMAPELLEAARDAICHAFGVHPAMMNRSTTGPVIREAQRALALWVLQPLALVMGEEATRKLGEPVAIDVATPLQSYDAGGRARAFGAVLEAMAVAKAGGLSAEEIAAAAAFAGVPNE